MILASLRRWKPQPGQHLALVPTAAAVRAAAAAPESPVPPSFLQRDHLAASAAAAAGGRAHHAYTGIVTELPGDLDVAALTRAVGDFVKAHEALRCWFTPGFARHVVPAEAVAFDAVAVQAPDPHTYLTRRFEAECTPFSWPGVSAGAISRPGGFSLYLGADHAHTDGSSHALAITELAERYYAHRDGTAFAVPADLARSHLEYVAGEYSAAAAQPSVAEASAAWQDILADHGWRLPRFPLDLGLAPGDTAPVRIVEVPLLDGAALARFEAVCKAAGARVSGGVFAAFALAERELTGSASYLGLTVLSTRGGPFTFSQGWFCSFAPVAFPVPGAFTAAAGAAQRGFDRAKKLSAVPAHAAIAPLLASGRLAGAAASPQMVNYLDARWSPGAGRPADANAVQFTGEGRTANANMWVVRDSHSLYLGAQAPDTPQAGRSVVRFLGQLRRVLDTVAQTGDYRCVAGGLREVS